MVALSILAIIVVLLTLDYLVQLRPKEVDKHLDNTKL